MKPQTPSLDFTTFVLSVSSAAFCSITGEQGVPVDLGVARHNVDLLEMLTEKTRGNLSADESALLQRLLFEVRLKYIEAQSALKR